MRAYKFYRFEQYPDIVDILNDGRKSSVGRLDEKSYCSPSNKRRIRRYLKRRDRACANRYEQDADC